MSAETFAKPVRNAIHLEFIKVLTESIIPQSPQTGGGAPKNLTICNAVWAGSTLGPIHSACLRSFLRAGHKVHLHVYEMVSDIPTGVVQFDANSLLPWSRVEKYVELKRFDIFSDAFRYCMLKAGLGCYIDCDVYCLKPLESSDFIFAWEDASLINGAVLMLPQGSRLLETLITLLDSKQPPEWYGKRKRLAYYAKSLLGQHTLRDFRWGVIGPDALTWFAKKYNLGHLALPADYFYPVHYQRVQDFLDPELTIEDLITHRTRCVHLFNECLREWLPKGIPATSPLGQMLRAQLDTVT